MAEGLQLTNHRELVVRGDLGGPPLDAEFGGDGRRGDRVIAGEHGDLGDPVGTQRVEHLTRLGTQLVGQTHQTDERAVDGQQQRCLARLP